MRHDRRPLPSIFLILAGVTACQSAAPVGGASSSTSASVGAMPPSAEPAVQAPTMEQAGEYLTIVGSCNDC
ncbi:MAG: hypothetical protein ABJA80_15770, partial [bacterium]